MTQDEIKLHISELIIQIWEQDKTIAELKAENEGFREDLVRMQSPQAKPVSSVKGKAGRPRKVASSGGTG